MRRAANSFHGSSRFIDIIKDGEDHTNIFHATQDA